MRCASKLTPVTRVALITAACLAGDSMLYVVLPLHWREAGLASLWQAGVLLSVNRLVRLPLTPVIGHLYRWIHPQRGVRWAVPLAVAATAGYGWAEGFVPWLFLRCLWGLAWTLLRLGAYRLIADSATEQNRGHAMGRYNGLYRLGSLFGMLVGGLCADLWGLSITSLLCAVVTLFGWPLAQRLLARPSAPALCPSTTVFHGSTAVKPLAASVPTARTATVLDRRTAAILATGGLLAMIYQGVVPTTLGSLLEARRPLSVWTCTFVVGSSSLAGFLLALRWGWEPWLAPRIGRFADGKAGRLLPFLGSLMLASLLFALSSLPLPTIPWLFVVLGLLGTATALTTLIDTLAADLAVRSDRTGLLTAHSFCLDLGAALGPTLGLLFPAPVVYTGISVVLSLMALAWSVKHPARRINRPTAS